MVSIAYSFAAALSNDNKQSSAYHKMKDDAENNMDHVNRLNENKYTTRYLTEKKEKNKNKIDLYSIIGNLQKYRRV